MQVGKNDAFEIPLTYVQHCQAQKNEVSTYYEVSTWSEGRYLSGHTSVRCRGTDGWILIFIQLVLDVINHGRLHLSLP